MKLFYQIGVFYVFAALSLILWALEKHFPAWPLWASCSLCIIAAQLVINSFISEVSRLSGDIAVLRGEKVALKRRVERLTEGQQAPVSRSRARKGAVTNPTALMLRITEDVFAAMVELRIGSAQLNRQSVLTAHRVRMFEAHPDKPHGSHEEATRVNAARDKLLNYLGRHEQTRAVAVNG